MAVRLKANIAYQPIVEEVSRKFVPKKETCSMGVTAGPVKTESNGWMGGAVRTTGRAGLGQCKRNYLVIRSNARSTQPSGDELAARALFTRAAKGRQTINRDLQQIVIAEQLYTDARKALEQGVGKTCNGVSVYGYTSQGWIFAVQYAGLANSSAYDEYTFPTKFDGE